MRAVCQASLRFADEHATSYRVLFERHRTEPAQDTANFDVHTIRVRCVQRAAGRRRRLHPAGRSSATAPLDATIRLWVGLHGLVTLHASLPWCPWPPVDALLVDITDRLTDLHATAARPATPK